MFSVNMIHKPKNILKILISDSYKYYWLAVRFIWFPGHTSFDFLLTGCPSGFSSRFPARNLGAHHYCCHFKYVPGCSGRSRLPPSTSPFLCRNFVTVPGLKNHIYFNQFKGDGTHWGLPASPRMTCAGRKKAGSWVEHCR